MASSVSDNIYFHLNLSNNTLEPLLGRIQLSRNQDILSNPSEYYLRITYVNMSSDSIPLFVMTPGTLSITLVGANNIPFTQILQPVPIFNLQPNYFYYVQQFVDSINNALVLANTACNASNGTLFNPPVLVYSFEQRRFLFVIDSATFNGNGIPQKVNMFFNSQLFTKFNAFYSKAQAGTGNIEILVFDNGLTYSPTGISASLNYPSYIITYEGYGFQNIIEIKGIAFISNTMPINQEFININTDGSGGNNNDFRPLLVEIPYKSIENTQKNIFDEISFANNFFPHLIDIKSEIPLRNIDFQAFFINDLDAREPIYLSPGNNLSLRFAFVKKTLFNIDRSKLLYSIAS